MNHTHAADTEPAWFGGIMRIDTIACQVGVVLILALAACSAEPRERPQIASAGSVRPSPRPAPDCVRSDESSVARDSVSTCDDSSGGLPPLPPDAPDQTMPQGRFGYDIVYRQSYESEKRGRGWDVTYRATLIPNTSPDAADQLVGEGRYEGTVTVYAANCTNPHRGPETVQLSGKLDASGGVVEDPSGTLATGKVMSFVLATKDWTILPLGGVAQTAEEKEAATGAGTVAKLLLPLTGSVTHHRETKKFDENECNGVVMSHSDITITERDLGVPTAAARR